MMNPDTITPIQLQVTNTNGNTITAKPVSNDLAKSFGLQSVTFTVQGSSDYWTEGRNFYLSATDTGLTGSNFQKSA